MFGLVFKYFPPFPQVCALRLLVSILASLDFNALVCCAGNETAYELAKLAELREPTHLQAK